MRAAKPTLLPFINEFRGLQSPIQSKVLPRCKMSTKQPGGGAASENDLRFESKLLKGGYIGDYIGFRV